MLALQFPSGVSVTRDRSYVAADWTGSAQLPPDIQTDLQWDVAILIDLDAPYPSSHTLSPLLHWIVQRDGHQHVEWLPMRPPSDSPPHRYQLILYRQTTVTPPMAPIQRSNFDLIAFTRAWSLVYVSQLDYISARGLSTPTSIPSVFTALEPKTAGSSKIGFTRTITVRLKNTRKKYFGSYPDPWEQ